MRFGWFFFVMSFQFAISIFFAIGIPGTGAAGISVAITTTNNKPEAGIVVFTAAGMWILHSLLSFWIITRTVAYYRSTGGVSVLRCSVPVWCPRQRSSPPPPQFFPRGGRGVVKPI